MKLPFFLGAGLRADLLTVFWVDVRVDLPWSKNMFMEYEILIIRLEPELNI